MVTAWRIYIQQSSLRKGVFIISGEVRQSCTGFIEHEGLAGDETACMPHCSLLKQHYVEMGILWQFAPPPTQLLSATRLS